MGTYLHHSHRFCLNFRYKGQVAKTFYQMEEPQMITTRSITTDESHTGEQTSMEKSHTTTQELMAAPLERKLLILHIYFRRGTVKAMKNFNAERECENLKAAMKGSVIGSVIGLGGTDDNVLINVLTGTSNEQRQEIVNKYKVLFGTDLIDDVEAHTSFNFGKVCTGLLRTLREYEAHCLMKAIKGLGTDEDTIIEIICTCKEIEELKDIYHTAYGNTLENDVIGDTSGDFQTLLVALLQGDRSMEEPDPVQAVIDAKRLYDAGEGVWGTDVPVFITIFSSRSFKHLRAVFNEYDKLSNRNITEAIESEHLLYGNLGKTLTTIVRVAQDKNLYFAQRLHGSMKGLGTNDDTLIRVILRTCETVLSDVKDVFVKEYEDTLANWIIDDTSYDYQKILLALIGERKQEETSNTDQSAKELSTEKEHK
ncbi:annexin A13-like [Glandiceps talaboti]